MFKNVFRFLTNKLLKFSTARKKTEIEYVQAALDRYRAREREMSSKFDPRFDFCLTCSNPEWSRLVDKIERVENWLKVL